MLTNMYFKILPMAILCTVTNKVIFSLVSRTWHNFSLPSYGNMTTHNTVSTTQTSFN